MPNLLTAAHRKMDFLRILLTVQIDICGVGFRPRFDPITRYLEYTCGKKKAALDVRTAWLK